MNMGHWWTKLMRKPKTKYLGLCWWTALTTTWVMAQPPDFQYCTTSQVTPYHSLNMTLKHTRNGGWVSINQQFIFLFTDSSHGAVQSFNTVTQMFSYQLQDHSHVIYEQDVASHLVSETWNAKCYSLPYLKVVWVITIMVKTKYSINSDKHTDDSNQEEELFTIWLWGCDK
jgi:hypothetical protein